MSEMLKQERIQAALSGKEVDRAPVGFWRHWPGDDQSPESLAAVTIDFQRRYDLDFIKVPVSSVYCVEDYGIKHEYKGSPNGDRVYTGRVIKRVEDWDRIEPLDVRRGTYGWNLQALGIIVERRSPGTPVIFTVFNPTSMASYLAGEETFMVHLRSRPDKVERALQALTQTCAGFVKAAVAAGADGIFLSTRHASYEAMNEDEYRWFGRPGDLAVLAAASGGWFNVLHLHGQHPMFALLSDYPAHAVNWHDRTTGTGLAEGARLFAGAVMGGVEQYQTLHYGSPVEVESQVYDAIGQMGRRRLIVSPGCTYPLTVPHRSLLAMRMAVETPNGLIRTQ